MKAKHLTDMPTSQNGSQGGGMLIESLVSVLIMAIIGGGIMHVTARMLNAQRDAAVTNVVVNELRPLIMSRTMPNGTSDLCGTGTLQVNVPGVEGEVAVTKSNCTAASIVIKDAANATIATVTAPQPVVLSLGNSSDGSLISVGGSSN